MRISDWSSDVCQISHRTIGPVRPSRQFRRNSIIDENIEAAKDIDSRVDQVGNFTFLAYVCAGETRFPAGLANGSHRSEEHTSELQSLMRISYAVFCLTKKYTYHGEIQK